MRWQQIKWINNTTKRHSHHLCAFCCCCCLVFDINGRRSRYPTTNDEDNSKAVDRREELQPDAWGRVCQSTCAKNRLSTPKWRVTDAVSCSTFYLKVIHQTFNYIVLLSFWHPKGFSFEVLKYCGICSNSETASWSLISWTPSQLLGLHNELFIYSNVLSKILKWYFLLDVIVN